MEKVNITTVYTEDNKTLYTLDHPSNDGVMWLNFEELLNLYQRLSKLCQPSSKVDELTNTPKPHLIIHETDCHGQGCIVYNGKIHPYSYDDGEMGDAKGAVEGLIEIGFIDPNDVTIIEGEEIYQHLNIK